MSDSNSNTKPGGSGSQQPYSDPGKPDFPCPPKMKRYLGRLRDFAVSIAPQSGLGTAIRQTSSGRPIDWLGTVSRGGKGGGAGVIHTPWEISVAESPAGSGQYYASVRPGSVNSLVPSNIFSTFLLVGGVNYVKIKCDTDGKTPNLITVMANTNPTESAVVVAENTAPPTFYDVIGLVRQTTSGNPPATSNQIFQVRYTNLQATPIIDFLVPATPSNPGDEPFKRWWRWSIA